MELLSLLELLFLAFDTHLQVKLKTNCFLSKFNRLMGGGKISELKLPKTMF